MLEVESKSTIHIHNYTALKQLPLPLPNIKYLANRSSTMAHNFNPKLRLNTNTLETCAASLYSRKREKFLPGFALYDPAVGLPDSPPESPLLPPMLPMAEPAGEGLYMDGEMEFPGIGDMKQVSQPLQSMDTKPLSRTVNQLKLVPVHSEGALSFQRAKSSPSPPPPATAGLSHSPRDLTKLKLRSASTIFFNTTDFTTSSPYQTEKQLIYTLSSNSSIIIPWTTQNETRLRQLWSIILEYDASCGNQAPQTTSTRLGKIRERASYQSVAVALLYSNLDSQALCTVWDRCLTYTKPERVETQFVKGWLTFTEFLAVVWGTGMERNGCRR